MGYAIAAPAQAVVPIDATTDLFPVHRIYCVGRNYADHAATGEIVSGASWLDVRGQKRQETIEHLSRYFTLAPGDLIFTGTPEGVGAVKAGDLMAGGIAGIGTLQVRVV